MMFWAMRSGTQHSTDTHTGYTHTLAGYTHTLAGYTHTRWLHTLCGYTHSLVTLVIHTSSFLTRAGLKHTLESSPDSYI